MQNDTQITDQRAGLRPIAFALENAGFLSDPVVLTVRPEDLTKNEPNRLQVHQTLGRQVSGWADDFGVGLPTCTIAGHTGWGAGGRPDGATAFHDLRRLIKEEYPAAVQQAIDDGMDPSFVKLLFIDMLDDFTWVVKPTSFQLRRSKSRPLLFMYNITLQALITDVENPIVIVPDEGDVQAGQVALDDNISELEAWADKVEGLVSEAVGYVNNLISPIAQTVKGFLDKVTRVYKAVQKAISAIRNGVSSVVNSIIGIATDLSRIGAMIFKTITAIANLPEAIKADLGRIGAAFQETYCIFKNSLRPGKFYEEYTGLYGASNCSSTTGGNPASVYAQKNAFALMHGDTAPVTMNSAAQSSVMYVGSSDPVLAPMPIAELNRHVGIITNGVSV